MTVLITGATGMIGQELVKLLHQNNITVHYLSTSLSKLKSDINYKGFYWNPKNNEIDPNAFENVTTIFHLAGATVAKKWTKAYKEEILESRILPTNVLFNFLKENKNKVTQLISASAIGIYPHSYTSIHSENSTEIDKSFLGNVVHQWEKTVDDFESLSIIVTKIRIGIVLSEKGGAFEKMVMPIKFGLGAAFGTGFQYQSWIHIDDLVSIFYYTMKHQLAGIFNAVAPHPVTNLEMTKTIAKKLKRPLWMPNLPKFLMKIILGEMHQLVFSSQHVSALKILNTGFQFKFATIEKAVHNLLK